MLWDLVTIYTDSQYAFSTTHVFAQMWKNRGMITSTGKPVNHATLLQDLLNAIQLPKQLAICKCAAHTKKNDPMSLGNARADEVTKAASHQTDAHVADETSHIDPTVLRDMQTTSPDTEKQLWINKGATLKDDTYF